jgi:hypothetical protein
MVSKAQEIEVIVIGAGCSGLTALKALLDQGINNVLCLEQNDDIGGNWYYSGSLAHSSVCETTHIISSKKLSEFADFPMPDEYPDYPSHAQVLQYFKNYAREFGLYEYIRCETKVISAKPISGGVWRVESDNGIWHAKYLLVCNGHHAEPRHPELPGDFNGAYLHAHAFKNNKPFIGKKVLVLGAGNSACDCAVECSRVAEAVDISIRRAQYIIPKFMMGKPTDSFNSRTLWMPSFVLNPLRRLFLRLQIGAYSSYGLDEPDFPVSADHPTINSELLYQMRHGKVTRRKAIKRIQGQRVYFEDGYEAEYDVMIAATGYQIATPFFDKNLIDFEDSDRVELYLRMFHPAHKNLIFIGLVQPQGAIWPLSELQSKIVAAYIAGIYRLPEDMQIRAKSEADEINKYFLKSKRNVLEVDFHLFRKRLTKELHIRVQKSKNLTYANGASI